MNILEIRHLSKHFPIRKGVLRRLVGKIKAVDRVSFTIAPGEIVGLVGESGSGKSTLGRAVMRLIEPTEGEIFFDHQDILAFSRRQLRRLRPQFQMVFQDPLSSLNPRKTILDNVGESLLFHRLVASRAEQADAVVNILQTVGIDPTALSQYPHQFSGGQQQRICIGRALILRPKLIICDEITSALDLSIQAQTLNLLLDLQKSFQLSYLIISHDLSVVHHLCDRVLVMHQGKIVEGGTIEQIFNHAQHPYTQNLLNSHQTFHQARETSSKTNDLDLQDCSNEG